MNRIQWLLVAGAWVGLSSLSAPNLRAETTLEELDQKIRVIERKLELSQEAEADKKKTAATVDLAKEGIALKSADGSFQVRFHGVVQADGRFYLDDQRNPFTNTFLIRRARPILDVTLHKDFDAYIVPDFGGGTTALQDAYLEYHPAPEFKIRAGKFKVPFGLERLQSDPNNKFIELALPSALVPNRDVGLQLYGDLGGGILSYAVGVFNGVADGGSGDTDVNDSKDVAARVFAQPFKKAYSNWINGLGLGLAYTQGTQTGALPTYRSAGQNTFYTYLSTVTANGERSRLSPQLYYFHGSFGLLAEYAVSSQEVQRGAGILKFVNNAWQTQASYLLTGEKSTYNGGVAPLKPFDWAAKQWGAWEVAARYGELTIDDDAFLRGVADLSASASQAKEWAAGINWYLNKNLKLAATYAETHFERGATRNRDRETEKVFLTRFQIAF